MTEEKQKRNRKRNPLTVYANAKAHADKVRKAAARAEAATAKAKELEAQAEKYRELAKELPAAEKAEQEALAALQATLGEIQGQSADETPEEG